MAEVQTIDYRFIGSTAQVGRVKMDRVGQRFRMTEEAGEMARKGGCQLLTEAEFAVFSFTDKQLKVWADPFMDPFDVPTKKDDAKEKADYPLKLDAARHAYRDIQQELLEPESKYVVEEHVPAEGEAE